MMFLKLLPFLFWEGLRNILIGLYKVLLNLLINFLKASKMKNRNWQIFCDYRFLFYSNSKNMIYLIFLFFIDFLQKLNQPVCQLTFHQIQISFMKSTSQQQLKRAIEQQLDLILKIQEDRKLLKRQNKSLNQKYLKITETLKKFSSISKSDNSTETQFLDEKPDHTFKQIVKNITVAEKIQKGCQVDLIDQQQNFNSLNNNSKLTEAMSFLKVIDTSNQLSNGRTNEANLRNNSFNILQNQSLRKMTESNFSKEERPKDKNAQITSEIVKMSKQISSLKKQLKDSEMKSKQKQKQHKQLKKCLETKSQALQKSRKQFNQLSLLLNNDKYKSIRNLEAQNQKLRQKAQKSDQQNEMIKSLKQVLENVTNQYQCYRQEKQRKIGSLIKQLKQKSHSVDELQIQMGQLKNQFQINEIITDYD